jgi:hypothetical protein
VTVKLDGITRHSTQVQKLLGLKGGNVIPQLNQQAVPVMPLWDAAAGDHRAIRGERMWGVASFATLAANQGRQVQLACQAGSNSLSVITRASIAFQCITPVLQAVVGIVTPVIGGTSGAVNPVFFGDGRLGLNTSPQSQTLSAFANVTVALAVASIFSMKTIAAAAAGAMSADWELLRADQPIVLPPNTSCTIALTCDPAVGTNLTSGWCTLTIQGYERVADPSELVSLPFA